MISCIYDARDVGKGRSAVALAYAAADEGCYSLYVPSCGETPPSTGCITEFGNDHCSKNFVKSRGRPVVVLLYYLFLFCFVFFTLHIDELILRCCCGLTGELSLSCARPTADE